MNKHRADIEKSRLPLVEADGKRLLFDTGGRPETVLNNTRELGVDLQ
jgi:metal-dependent hydrolase (beta-lactamase superfamily II)